MNAVVAPTAAGVLLLRGKDSLDFVHRLSTNDLRPLAGGKRATTTVFTNEKGRIVDWTWVLPQGEDLLLRTSPGRAHQLASWLERYIIVEDVSVHDVSDSWRTLVLQGSDVAASVGLPCLPGVGELLEVAGALAMRGLAAYGERLELLLPAGQLERWLEMALAAGAQRGTEEDLERLRLLAGVPSPEHEFKEEVNPLELRIGKIAISWSKGCYIGQEVIARLDSYDKLARQLIGFEADVAIIEPPRELKLWREGRPLGKVTSCYSDGQRTLGLAVVKREAAAPGAAELVCASGPVSVRLVDRPFWQPAAPPL